MPLYTASERETKRWINDQFSTRRWIGGAEIMEERNTHAMAAACKVEINPEIIALRPIRAIRRLRDGASAVSTPIWMPSELRFANPQSAYDAIVNPRFDSASSEAISFSSWMYATNSFSISLVARSSEMRRISERGTPATCQECRFRRQMRAEELSRTT